jgi:hypothetical protein
VAASVRRGTILDVGRPNPGSKENVQMVIKFSRLLGVVAIVCSALVGLLNTHAVAQEQTTPEFYQAQTLGQGTQFGQTFSVNISIERYSSPEERQILIDAFNKVGSQGLYNALEKFHSYGRLAITGTLGYDVSFARKIKTDDGYTIRLLTNRPIRFGEAWVNGRSMDYNLSLVELNINDDMKKSTGTLLPACQFKVNKKTGEVEVEAYRNPWKLQNIMNRSK